MRKFFCAILVIVSSSAFGQLRLPSVISSGMVLQQNDSVSIWGWGYSGDKVNVTGSWNNVTVTAVVANDAKWEAKVNTPKAGGPYTILISSSGGSFDLQDVMIGEVWLCSGQSNMEWSYYNGAGFIKDELPTCYNRNIRFFDIPRATAEYPQDDIAASWTICDSNTIKAFSAVGYYFGRKLQSDLDVPVGLINASWGGTPAEVWTPAEKINNNPTLRDAASRLKEYQWWPAKPGLTFNGMLAPVTKFKIAGAIWYQGEGNTETNSTYAELLTAMIDAWREKWKKQLPFYYVQIAPYKYGNENVGALIQEQQTKVLSHPNTGMVVVTDLIDSVTNIHPSNKRDVGYRLAGWAIGETYHKGTDAYKSPMFEKAESVKGRLVLSFANVPNGLKVKGKVVTGFFVSGDNGVWLPADAKIEGNRISVWNKTIKQPLYVRYGFGNTIVGNVFSTENLPLCPFRSDSWPVDQSPVKN